MRTVLGTTALTALLVAIVLLWFDGPVEFTGYEVLLLLLAVMAVRRLRPVKKKGESESRLRPKTKPVRRPNNTPPQLEKIERLVVFSKTAAFDAEWRLLPLLRFIASEQLQARHGIDLTTSPDQASRLLGAEGWDLLDPARELSEDRLGPGLSLQDLNAAVAAIEEL